MRHRIPQNVDWQFNQFLYATKMAWSRVEEFGQHSWNCIQQKWSLYTTLGLRLPSEHDFRESKHVRNLSLMKVFPQILMTCASIAG